MFIDGSIHQLPDIDPQETAEWLESLDAVIDVKGKARAHYLLARLMERARDKGAFVPAMVTTDYINTIPPEQEPWFPGDEDIERRIRAFVRWNAVAMVDRANHRFDGLGGHLSTYASAASLYEVGFNHFFRGKGDGGFGDQVFFQGHAAPGIYAARVPRGPPHRGAARPLPPRDRRPRACRRTRTRGACRRSGSSRRCRWASARSTRSTRRASTATSTTASSSTRRTARVWCFVGDGELDEPEATAGTRPRVARTARQSDLRRQLQPAAPRRSGARQRQGDPGVRVDVPRHGLERHQGRLGPRVGRAARPRRRRRARQQDEHHVDGEFQKYAVESGAYIREHFFGPDPRLRKMVEHLSDEELQRLPRGGHDYRKLYAAYKTAVEHEGAPTVILAKTIKGWTLGTDFEGAQRDAPDQEDDARPAEGAARPAATWRSPTPRSKSGMAPYFHPGFRSPEYEYMMERRRAARRLPARTRRALEDA